jgi:hypothetical protein
MHGITYCCCGVNCDAVLACMHSCDENETAYFAECPSHFVAFRSTMHGITYCYCYVLKFAITSF